MRCIRSWMSNSPSRANPMNHRLPATLALLAALASAPALADDKADGQLLEAAKTGKVDDVKAALAAGANLEAKEKTRDQCRALLLAAKGGHLDVGKLLLEKGADIEAGDWDDDRALEYAADEGKLEVAEFLIGKGAKTDVADTFGRRPILR